MPQDISMATILAKNHDIIESHLDDEIVLMSIGKSNYYGLKTTSLRIWELLEKPQRLEELCQTLQKEYDAPPGNIEKDVMKFVQEMNSHSLLLTS